MELPTKVRVYNQIMALSGNPGTLVGVRAEGYYELQIANKEGEIHVVLLPISQTGLLFFDPEPEIEPVIDVER